MNLRIFAAFNGLALLLSAGLSVAAPPPANDLIENAAAVPALPYTATADLVNSTGSASDPGYCNDGHSGEFYTTVWYRYTATGADSIDITGSTTSTTDGPKAMSLYSGAPDSLQYVGCGQINPFYDQNTIRFVPTVGATYYLMVASIEPIEPSDVIGLTFKPSPAPNDGTVTVGSRATAYNSIEYDIEHLFYLKHHVVISLQVTCSPAVASIDLDATVHQGSSYVEGTGSVSCSSGVGSLEMDLAPIQPFPGYEFVTGPATVDVKATDLDSNYAVTVTGAPTYITLKKKPVR